MKSPFYWYLNSSPFPVLVFPGSHILYWLLQLSALPHGLVGFFKNKARFNFFSSLALLFPSSVARCRSVSCCCCGACACLLPGRGHSSAPGPLPSLWHCCLKAGTALAAACHQLVFSYNRPCMIPVLLFKDISSLSCLLSPRYDFPKPFCKAVTLWSSDSWRSAVVHCLVGG